MVQDDELWQPIIPTQTSDVLPELFWRETLTYNPFPFTHDLILPQSDADLTQNRMALNYPGS
jgi:hypothetical protein